MCNELGKCAIMADVGGKIVDIAVVYQDIEGSIPAVVVDYSSEIVAMF